MKLCITEKPDVARSIAALLGASVRRNGYFEGNGYNVTWTYGHLCSLKDPVDYTPMWKHWAMSTLPMLPERFGIKVMTADHIQRQFKVIESLIPQASEVINCGDAGQEGELIQRWVMQKAGVNCPVMRLWTSSLTDEALREGFEHLTPAANYDRLYYAGLSRAIGDWILGINATRLYSLKYSEPGKVLSVGRVQTPTLALIVQRYREINNFKSEEFWELKSTYRDVVFSAQTERIKSGEEAEKIKAKLEGLPFIVKEIQQKKGRESAPKLFDLTSLQVECNKRWGWSADETLRLIQSLYEKKVTTYPRVDTTYLSEDIHKKVPEIMRKMQPYAPLTAPLLAAPIPKPKRIFDNAKVTDHHAIIPTGQSPAILVGDEKKLYHLIALRFIAAFYPDCEFQLTTVEGVVGDVRFKANGKVIRKPGWRDVLQRKSDQDKAPADDDADSNELPPFEKGEQGPQIPSLQKKNTQPPKHYTEGTLLRAMESAGRTIEDEELREAMKENGIGRPSTRSAIIETLFKRGYIRRERKNIIATEAGVTLIDTIDEELLKSAKLTGIWENKLRRIERGDYSAAEFINEMKQLISEIVINVMRDNSRGKIHIENVTPEKPESGQKSKKATKPRTPRVTKFEQIVCPVCGQGHVVKGNTAYGCSRYREGCTFRMMFADVPSAQTPGKLNAEIKKKFK